VQEKQAENLVVIGVGSLFNRKPAISLKLDKTGPRLLLMTNKKLHTRFRLIPKSTTLDDLERALPTLLHNKVFFGAHYKNLNEGTR